MTRARSTFAWMAALSVVTLLLGVTREFAIARELRASGAADLFFRGLVVIGAARAFGLALFRARWIPVGPEVAATTLLRQELATSALISAVSAAALVVIVGLPAFAGPVPWVILLCVLTAVFGGAIRALAERAGYEKRGFVLEWGVPIGTIAGALALPGGALGPTIGLLGGLLLGAIAIAPVALRPLPNTPAPGEGDPTSSRSDADADAGRARTRWLLLDTLVYVNLGLLDAGVSHVFDEGGFALLNYAYLFVNSILMVPTAAATVVALRFAAEANRDPDPSRARAAHRTLRRWSLLGGVLIGALVAGVAWTLSWPLIANPIDAAAGWDLASRIQILILYSAPFAGLRFANTVGRQQQVASNPRALIVWDLLGLAFRTALLVGGATLLGLDVLASPLALALAEIVQLWAWAPASRTPHTAGTALAQRPKENNAKSG